MKCGADGLLSREDMFCHPGEYTMRTRLVLAVHIPRVCPLPPYQAKGLFKKDQLLCEFESGDLHTLTAGVEAPVCLPCVSRSCTHRVVPPDLQPGKGALGANGPNQPSHEVRSDVSNVEQKWKQQHGHEAVQQQPAADATCREPQPEAEAAEPQPQAEPAEPQPQAEVVISHASGALLPQAPANTLSLGAPATSPHDSVGDQPPEAALEAGPSQVLAQMFCSEASSVVLPPHEAGKPEASNEAAVAPACSQQESQVSWCSSMCPSPVKQHSIK